MVGIERRDTVLHMTASFSFGRSTQSLEVKMKSGLADHNTGLKSKPVKNIFFRDNFYNRKNFLCDKKIRLSLLTKSRENDELVKTLTFNVYSKVI